MNATSRRPTGPDAGRSSLPVPRCILAIPFISGACSANGFKAQVGSGVYIAAAPPALFLVASKARFHLVGPRGD